MNSCGSCNVCCSGAIKSEAYGHKFGRNKKCHFLIDEKCSIYSDRPETCKNYFCFYAQDIIHGLERPDENNILVTVVNFDGEQKLQCNLLPNFKREQVDLLFNFAKKHNTEVILLDNGRPFKTDNLTEETNPLKSVVNILKNFKEKETINQLLNSFLKNTDDIEERFLIAELQFKSKLYSECATNLKKIIEEENLLEKPEGFNSVNNYFASLYHINKPDEILEELPKALKIYKEDWHYVNFKIMEAISYFSINEKNKSKEILEDLLKNYKNTMSSREFSSINYNLAAHKFSEGDFKTAVNLHFTHGTKISFFNGQKEEPIKNLKRMGVQFKEWDGSTIKNATIVVVSSGGIGDDIIYVRFLKFLENRGMKAIWLENNFNPLDIPRKDLSDVFLKNGITTINDIHEINLKDPNVYLTESDHIILNLDLDVGDLWDGPYLKPDQIYVSKWGKIIKNNNKLKIGIRWSGNPDYEHDLHRSVPLKQIYEATKHLDADFYSLQIDNYQEEWGNFPGLIPAHKEIKTWDDTFGLIENLDFVITSCTSVAHAAASIGKRVFVFVPIARYFVWNQPGNKSNWYGDNVTLLYKQNHKNWDEPAKQLKDTLLLEYK